MQMLQIQTDTTAEDFRQDLEIVVAKLTLTGKTKK